MTFGGNEMITGERGPEEDAYTTGCLRVCWNDVTTGREKNQIENVFVINVTLRF